MFNPTWFRENLRKLFLVTANFLTFLLKMMARELVVPWSIAMMYFSVDIGLPPVCLSFFENASVFLVTLF